jgi:hypothetical protein
MVVPSLAQDTVGVSVGDHFRWVGTYSHVTDNPNGTVPPQVSLYAFWNETEYVDRTVASISGTDVTFDTTWHFTNGTADKTETEVISINNETGDNSHGFIIIGAGMEPGDIFTESATWGGTLSINDTVQIEYDGELRDTNYHFSTTGFFAVTYREWLFDKETGILVRALLNATLIGETDSVTTYTLELVDTDLWVVPEFPTGTVMLLVFVAVTVSIELIRRKKLKH